MSNMTLKLENENNTPIVKVTLGRHTRVVRFEKSSSASEFMKNMDCYCKLKTAKQLNLTGSDAT